VLFSSAIFVFLFLPIVLAGHTLLPRVARNAFLTLASLFFYAWGEPRVVLVMLGSIGLNWVFGLALERARAETARRAWLALALLANLGALGFYKYANFAAENANALRGWLGAEPWPWTPIALPIGISFFTFQILSYVIDVYRRQVPAQRDPLKLALYIALFPQLIAGPIVRYVDIAHEIDERQPTRALFAYGIRRFVLGLAKKMVVANTVAVVADGAFGEPSAQLGAGLAWLGALCYALQIYFDFSGYSDMAIGLGAMFGFRFLENFDHPYVARSITEFWRRWHISLSSWFRDYLYIPLGGNRGSKLATYRNLLVVFTLCGLWHGASWNFVVWGLHHGVFLVLERMGLAAWLERRPALVRHAYVLFVVLTGWVFFRAVDLAHALAYLAAMAGFGEGGALYASAVQFLDPWTLCAIALGAALSFPVRAALLAWCERRAQSSFARVSLGAARSALVLALFGLCCAMLAAKTNNPFIYFRF
jgi:alginate O-acetyltransferase complex protein AlgI